MKIAQFVFGFGGGGAPNVALSLTKELLRFGHSVDVIILNKKYNNAIEEKSLTELDSLKIINHRLNRNNGSFGVKSFIRFIKLIKKEKYDIIHSHLFVPDLYCALAIFLAKHKFTHITTVHNSIQYHPKILVNTLFRESYFVKCSPAINRLESNNNEYVVSNAIDFDVFSPSNKYDFKCLREELGIDKSSKIVVSVGNLRVQKNHKAGFYMIKYLIDNFNFKNIHLILCGFGPEKENLVNLSNDLDISENIHFLGLRDDIANVLNQSDVFINFSKWEGLPLSVIEAFSSGIPTILSPINEHKVISKDIYQNFISEGFDGKSFALILSEIFNKPIFKSHIEVFKLREDYLKEYSLDFFSKSYIDIYNKHTSKI